MKNTIIYLIGFSGTGKYTLAKALAEQIAATIIDNQLINTPIFAAIGADGMKRLPLGVWREIRTIRTAVFNAVLYLADGDDSFIFTNELLAKSKGDNALFQEIEEIAQVRKAIFVPIRLFCERGELLTRIAMTDRKTRFKAVDAEDMAMRLETSELYLPQHANLLELDITRMKPQDAAAQIIEHIKRLTA